MKREQHLRAARRFGLQAAGSLNIGATWLSGGIEAAVLAWHHARCAQTCPACSGDGGDAFCKADACSRCAGRGWLRTSTD